MRRLAEIETVLDGLTNVALTRKLGVFKLSLIQWWFLRIKFSLQLKGYRFNRVLMSTPKMEMREQPCMGQPS